MIKQLAALAISLSISASACMPAMAAGTNLAVDDAVVVTVDQAKVFRVSRPAATVIIGNPSIVDATVEDDRTLILTGRSFGVTNLIILDVEGSPIIDRSVVVRGHETNTVRIYRRDSRETLACAPVCEPTLTIGDNNTAFDYASKQIQARNTLSQGGN